jgi:hypothetical protein
LNSPKPGGRFDPTVIDPLAHEFGSMAWVRNRKFFNDA